MKNTKALFGLVIRRATLPDLPAMAAIEAGHSSYPAWGEKGLGAEFVKKFSVTLVAYAQNELLGFINFWILKPQIQLNAVVTAPAALKRGAATALIKKLEEYAAKNDCVEIDLEVNAANEPAIGLYRKLGFLSCGRRPKFYNNSDDAILMKKLLNGLQGNL